MSGNKAPQTIAAANGLGEDSAFGAVAPPIYLSTTFRFPSYGQAGQYDYSRSANPTLPICWPTRSRS